MYGTMVVMTILSFSNPTIFNDGEVKQLCMFIHLILTTETTVEMGKEKRLFWNADNFTKEMVHVNLHPSVFAQVDENPSK